jgi:hypothetical protein
LTYCTIYSTHNLSLPVTVKVRGTTIPSEGRAEGQHWTAQTRTKFYLPDGRVTSMRTKSNALSLAVCNNSCYEYGISLQSSKLCCSSFSALSATKRINFQPRSARTVFYFSLTSTQVTSVVIPYAVVAAGKESFFLCSAEGNFTLVAKPTASNILTMYQVGSSCHHSKPCRAEYSNA